MVRKTQIDTKHGRVLISIIEGEQLPFDSRKSDCSLSISPHQSSSLFSTKNVKRPQNLGHRELQARCLCIEKGSLPIESLDNIMFKMAKDNSLFWLDPTLIPVECLASIFAKWLWDTKPTRNLGLGMIIPSLDSFQSKESHFTAWTSTSSGSVQKKLAGELPIWVSLVGLQTENSGKNG